MVLSFTLQAIAITTAVIVSIFTVDKLGAVSLPQLMPPAPRAPKAVQIVASTPRGPANPSILRTSARPVFVPSRIPTHTPMITDAPEMALAPAQALGVGIGVPDGVPNGLHFIPGSGPVVATPPPAAPTPQPQAVTPKKVRVGGDVLEAKLVKRVMPVYPPLARQARVSGVVRLEGVIARDGRVINLQVHSGHPLLVGAAVQAVREWMYQPTLLNGEPVEVIAPIEVRFVLGSN